MAFGRGAYGPLSNTFNEISRMMENEQIRKADHEFKMGQIELQNKKFEADQAQQEYMRPQMELKRQQAQAQLQPVKYNLRDFMEPDGDPYNTAHIAQLSDHLIGALNDGTGQWDPKTLDLVGVDGQPITAPAHIAQRKMAGAFGTILAHTDPVKDKQRKMYMMMDAMEQHKATKPTETDSKYAQGGFPEADLRYKDTLSAMEAQMGIWEQQLSNPQHMKMEYVKKMSELEEMRGQLIGIGAGDRVMGFLGEAADRYEKILGDLDDKMTGGKGSKNFVDVTNNNTGKVERHPYEKALTMVALGKGIYTMGKGGGEGKVTIKEKALKEWKEDPDNEGKTILEFERDYAKMTQKGMGERNAIQMLSEESMMYDIDSSPYKNIMIDGQPISNEILNQIWQRGYEALTKTNPNLSSLEALNRIKLAQPSQDEDGSVWLELENGKSLFIR